MDHWLNLALGSARCAGKRCSILQFCCTTATVPENALNCVRYHLHCGTIHAIYNLCAGTLLLMAVGSGALAGLKLPL